MHNERNKKVTVATEYNLTECSKEFLEFYWEKKCDKGSVVDTLNMYVNSRRFLELLDKMKNKSSDWNVGYGMLFPEDFDDPDNPDDEENIGENNICFFQVQTMRITKISSATKNSTNILFQHASFT